MAKSSGVHPGVKACAATGKHHPGVKVANAAQKPKHGIGPVQAAMTQPANPGGGLAPTAPIGPPQMPS